MGSLTVLLSFSTKLRCPPNYNQAMGAKFHMCLLLVIMVTAPVYCARLRRALDAEKSSLFLYGRLFQGNFESFL